MTNNAIQFPDKKPAGAARIAVVASITIIDVYEREHENLPVAWVYMKDKKDWYFEPCPTMFQGASPAGAE